MTLPSSDPPLALPVWHAALLLVPIVGALVAALFARTSAALPAVWRVARGAAGLAVAASAVSLAAVVAGHGGVLGPLRADAPGAVVLLLVSFIGWVIVRYSQPYLDAERGERGYVVALATVLAAVGAVVVANHLLLIVVAWSATSFALHRLLTFFGDRRPAVLAAHKKFVFGRVADLCMATAAVLLAFAFGSLQLDALTQAAAAGPLPAAAQVAAVLVAIAALLKCAQLPFHGWLIQVMEAPTPVSALLHAGVVNLGGFVLLRLAPLIDAAPAAQALLVVVGATTAVGAALVMTTRISIKVQLAWSTCAQMGFMLMQCGLGAWEMALLHLVAHSLYKAHAFLGAGGVVRRAQVTQLAADPVRPGVGAIVVGVVLGVGATATAAVLFGGDLAAAPALPLLAAIVGLALVPLLQARALALGGAWPIGLVVGAFAVAAAYFGLHALAAHVVPPRPTAPAPGLLLLVAIAFGALFVLQTVVTVAPHGALARRLFPWFYGGFFLDEWVARTVLSVWHPPLDISRPVVPGASA
ncbi:MAG: NADH-quinone oxidoreductase subunit L [Burkholderiales bacterium]|jgi:NAD(P)H-quinone oxidoreductase subunit 5|nr:NADH-quinone oxidoreductase subunit L [Burkholderiales bacterium]